MVRVLYMVDKKGDILISTDKEKDYKIVRSYTLNNNITNSDVWDKIGQLMLEYEKNGEHVDEEMRLYMFSKIFKDYLIPTSSCCVM